MKKLWIFNFVILIVAVYLVGNDIGRGYRDKGWNELDINQVAHFTLQTKSPIDTLFNIKRDTKFFMVIRRSEQDAQRMWESGVREYVIIPKSMFTKMEEALK